MHFHSVMCPLALSRPGGVERPFDETSHSFSMGRRRRDQSTVAAAWVPKIQFLALKEERLATVARESVYFQFQCLRLFQVIAEFSWFHLVLYFPKIVELIMSFLISSFFSKFMERLLENT